MKTLIIMLSIVTSSSALAMPKEYLEKMRESTLNTYELVVLNGSETVLDSVKFIKNERLFKKLTYELADWYKVALIKRDLSQTEVNRKLKDYQSHLIHLGNTDDPFIKKQLIQEYQQIDGVLSYFSEAEVEQIILARIYSKRIQALEKLEKERTKLIDAKLQELASASEIVRVKAVAKINEQINEEKVKNAALAMRVLSEAYVMAANSDLTLNQKELRERAQGFYSILLLGSFAAVPMLDVAGASDSFIKLFILGLWASSSAMVAEIFFDDTKIVRRIREMAVGATVKKEKAKLLIDIFWSHISAPQVVKQGPFILRDHLNYLQAQASINLEELSHKYRVLSTRKCILALNLLK